MLDDSFPTMGTIARVVRDADGDVDAASVFAEVDRRLSRFDSGSDLSRLNADPRECVPAGPLLRAAVGAALDAAQMSDGLVDPTVLGAVLRAGYQESRAHSRAPSLLRALDSAPRRRRSGDGVPGLPTAFHDYPPRERRRRSRPRSAHGAQVGWPGDRPPSP